MTTVIIGKTSSGKTLVVNELVFKHDFHKIVTYTSRPKRKGEKDGVDYHFITKEDFTQKIGDGFFAEWKSYTTVEGIWYYGTALEDLENAEDNSVIILPPDRFRKVKNILNDRVSSIYIYANNSTIKKRLVSRGDNPDEAKRRLEHDNEDFKGLENEVNRIVYNNDGTDIKKVIQKILEFLEAKS